MKLMADATFAGHIILKLLHGHAYVMPMLMIIFFRFSVGLFFLIFSLLSRRIFVILFLIYIGAYLWFLVLQIQLSTSTYSRGFVYITWT